MEGAAPDRLEAVVVIAPHVVIRGNAQKEISILAEQGFLITRRKTFAMSPSQTRAIAAGNDAVATKFGSGPVCALVVVRNDATSPYSALAELGLDTLYCTDSSLSTLRVKAALFPGRRQFERTLAVTSGAAGQQLLESVCRQHGFIVVARQERGLTAKDAERLRVHLSLEQKTLWVLEKDNAIVDLQLAVGDATVVSVSRTLAEADNAIQTYWPEGFPLQRTLALLKPDVTAAGHRAAILQAIVDAGFTVIAERCLQMTLEKTKAFYAEHAGKPFYDGLVEFMSSGPIVALALSKPNAVSAWRTLLGPTNSDTARQTAPNSIRAQFGTDGRRNAAHGSDSELSAARELRFFFADLPAASHRPVSAQEIEAILTEKSDFRKQQEASLNQVLIKGLTALCRTKPVGLAAVKQLGEWLRDNNPLRPVIIEPAAGAQKEYASTLEKLQERAPGGQIRIVFIVGPPGSGKGTQCEMMRSQLGYYHISSGDLLRAEVAKKTALGASIQARIIEGKLVDDDVILTLIENTMLKSGASTFIIDGFPSRIDQAIKFEERIAKCDFVLYLQASDEVILSRRRDDRVDDTAETLRKRLTTFHQEVLPTIQHYERFGKVKTVDASRPTDAVFADVRRAVAPNVPGSIEKRSTLDRLRQKSPTGTVYVVFVLGGPGSGKGTQCDMIKAQLGYFHISSGDLLRAEIAAKTPLGLSIQSLIVEGKLVDDDLILTLIETAMLKSGACNFLIDGFPRRLDQAFLFEKRIAKCDLVLYFDAPDEVLVQRLLDRGKSSGRSDDNTSTIQKRLATFHQESVPAVQHYQQFGKVAKIDAVRSKDAVFTDVKRVLGNLR
ncbi:Nucleoside diphosphate kinase-like domain-containing protein [Plasmodiophora brassicae]